MAIGSRSADRAAELAATLGVDARCYGSYDELVADPQVDVVYVATPHAQHHEHALLALRAGKPVLVEKAFTLTAREAREVIAEAAARDLFCMEAMWMRVNPLVLPRSDVADGAHRRSAQRPRPITARRFPFDPRRPVVRDGRWAAAPCSTSACTPHRRVAVPRPSRRGQRDR